MESRPTLEQFGPIVARLPSDWPVKSPALPRRKAVLNDLLPCEVIDALDPKKLPDDCEEICDRTEADDLEDFQQEGFADLPIAPTVLDSKLELTGSDKIESVLDALPDPIVRFVEDQMRARFVGVRSC